jgi:hypothetical protein
VIPERDRIQVVMTPAEITAALESGDYSAEMLMQHLIRHHNRLERERNDAKEELEQIKTILADPLAVHMNMMRGTIKWTPANLRALLGDTEP